MNQYRRVHAAAGMLGLVVLLCGALDPRSVRAQFSPGPIELSGNVTLDEADSGVRTSLARVKAYVADGQWDEAVESLRRLMESDGGKMIPLAAHRYVNLADYCHVQIAGLPPEALALYRQRVDPLAQTWYDEGLSARDGARLSELIDKLFCSSWGDDALLALGEIELERGHYSAARRAWERLIELPPTQIPADDFQAARAWAELPAETGALLDKWYVADEAGSAKNYRMLHEEPLSDADSAALVQFWKTRRLPSARMAYPGTEIPLADVRARLVLVSIMEGALKRAQSELESFKQLHPGARGRMAGRAVDYAETLASMISAAAAWAQFEPADDWSTFAGDYSRSRVVPRQIDLGPQAWPPISLGDAQVADSANSRAYSLRRVGEDAQRLMSHHPLVVGNLLLFCNHSQVFAFDVTTGQPAWPGDAKRPPGEIFVDDAVRQGQGSRVSRGLGVPRFSMTTSGGKLFARMGSQVTSRPLESFDSRPSGYLVCLDLEAQGRLVWRPDGRIQPDDDKWAFEGAPVVDGNDLYIAMRKSDVRPQAYVACFDVDSGRRRWRTLVCSAETPGGGQFEEVTHNLLTFEQGTLYFNTNLGAVAALEARDGHLQWVSLYKRAKKATPDGRDRRTAHFYRDLNPCVYARGKLLVAPADCDSIFALDAGTGQMIWDNQLPEDVVHLLGVSKGNLLASGDALWWIDAEQGKVLKRWPDTSPLGHGRGLLMGNQVVWPTNGELYLFDCDATTAGAAPRDPILLSERQAVGGNLVSAHGLLLIASPDKLFAFRQQGPVARREAPGTAAPVPQPAPAPNSPIE